MKDEIENMGVIKGMMGIGIKGSIWDIIIGVDKEDIEVLKVEELERVKIFKIEKEKKMKKMIIVEWVDNEMNKWIILFRGMI